MQSVSSFLSQQLLIIVLMGLRSFEWSYLQIRSDAKNFPSFVQVIVVED